jgi:hypothetical protein
MLEHQMLQASLDLDQRSARDHFSKARCLASRNSYRYRERNLIERFFKKTPPDMQTRDQLSGVHSHQCEPGYEAMLQS